MTTLPEMLMRHVSILPVLLVDVGCRKNEPQKDPLTVIKKFHNATREIEYVQSAPTVLQADSSAKFLVDVVAKTNRDNKLIPDMFFLRILTNASNEEHASISINVDSTDYDRSDAESPIIVDRATQLNTYVFFWNDNVMARLAVARTVWFHFSHERFRVDEVKLSAEQISIFRQMCQLSPTCTDVVKTQYGSVTHPHFIYHP